MCSYLVMQSSLSDLTVLACTETGEEHNTRPLYRCAYGLTVERLRCGSKTPLHAPLGEFSAGCEISNS